MKCEHSCHGTSGCAFLDTTWALGSLVGWVMVFTERNAKTRGLTEQDTVWMGRDEDWAGLGQRRILLNISGLSAFRMPEAGKK